MNSNASPTLPNPLSSGVIFFVTLRLHNALPESFMQNLGIQYYSKQVEYAQNPNATALLHETRKRLFARFDDLLDLEKYGQAHLREPALAQIVAEEVLRRDGSDYALMAYSILPNHVHLLLELPNPISCNPPLDELQSLRHEPLRALVRTIQKATEMPLKKTLRQLGEHIDPTTFQKQSTQGSVQMDGKFWHEQSFDFRIQDAAEVKKTTQYVLQNPGKTELGRDWPFSYASGS